jgi:hypothetical protein
MDELTSALHKKAAGVRRYEASNHIAHPYRSSSVGEFPLSSFLCK